MLLGAVVACNNINKNNGSSNHTSAGRTNTNIPATDTDFTKDSVITIRFPKDSSSITVTGKLTGINTPVTVYIPVTKGGELSVLLVPQDSVANIRINQIFFPDGKADGPFGRNLVRKITQPGNYKLVIGEDLMQGEEWKGKFSLSVAIN